MEHASSTLEIPVHDQMPRHVAIIMDGNGRWAQQRHLPRFAGHRRGVEAVREAVKTCIERGIAYLTLFAFSSENWRRPKDEVALLMQLFIGALTNEVDKLHRNGVRLRVIGDLTPFDARIRTLVEAGERLTRDNTRLTLTIAANYGGRWDILQAVHALLKESGGVLPEALTEAMLAPHLSMHYAPEPDLFIRTGGEQRVSNFLLWQLAYTELHFTERLWPDFDAAALDEALDSYRRRERRFGRTSVQVTQARNAQRDALAARGATKDPVA